MKLEIKCQECQGQWDECSTCREEGYIEVETDDNLDMFMAHGLIDAFREVFKRLKELEVDEEKAVEFVQSLVAMEIEENQYELKSK